MKKELKGLSKIFKFTFQQQTGRKGYRTATIVATVLLILLPVVILGGGAWIQSRDSVAEEEYEEPPFNYEEEFYEEESPEEEEPEPIDLSLLKKILVVNLTEDDSFSTDAISQFDYLNQVGVPLGQNLFQDYGTNLEAAMEDSKGSSDSLIVLTEEEGDGFYVTRILIPEKSSIPENLGILLSEIMSVYGNQAMSDDMVPEPEEDVEEEYWEEESLEEEDPAESVKIVLGYILPYLNIMVLYFFVLFYGQSAAQNVLMEKTSKLMEVFLVSVRPTAMILGKVTAICLSGVLQLTLWIFALIGGLLLGCKVMNHIAPEWSVNQVAQMLLDSFGHLTGGMFSIGGIVIALLILLSGMLLFCALAGIGGSLASKTEDLGSANMAFTLALVVSFLACLAGGGLEGLEGGSSWLNWIPFTAIMVTPARVLLGSVSLGKGLLCLVEVVITAILLTMVAGRTYKMMALYKGNPPKIKDLIKILRR